MADIATTYRIDRLGADGAGVTADGMRVPGGLPGETVTLCPDGSIHVDAPSPHRVAPLCRHAERCGGCVLQHAADGFVAAWKRDRVAAALAAQGLGAAFGPPHASPQGARRRATLAGRRRKKGAVVGFRAARSHEIVPIPGCLLLHPDLVATLPVLEALTLAGASRSGVVRFAVTATETGVDVAATGGKPSDAALGARLAGIAAEADLVRLTWDGVPLAHGRAPLLRLGRARVAPPPGAFLQATADGDAALLEAVRAAVGPARRIADLFAGCGTFALPLAEGATIHAVDTDAPALTALDAGWRGADGLHRVTTEARDLFARPLAGAELAQFDAVVIDPPRAGAAAQMQALAAHGPGRIAAVSCNPDTFARDAAILVAGGYVPGPVRVVDQFRWSAHVELAAGFTRRHIPGHG